MGFFRFEVKIFARKGRGRSVIAAAAYRAGTRLKDEIRDKVFNYLQKARGVVDTAIIAPEDAPPWALDSGKLWNTVEAGEKRKDAQLARELVLALPKELPADIQFQTAIEWARKELVSRGMIVELSLHHPRSGRNPHVHALCTMRKLDGDKFSAKKATEWNEVPLLVAWRKSWADSLNEALEKIGSPERVDHRSLKDRGLHQIPQPKIGVAATAMKRKGTLADPDRFKAVRKVKLLNDAFAVLGAIEQGGFNAIGFGGQVWDKTAAILVQIRDKAAEAAKNTWQKLIDSERGKPETRGPHIER